MIDFYFNEKIVKVSFFYYDTEQIDPVYGDLMNNIPIATSFYFPNGFTKDVVIKSDLFQQFLNKLSKNKYSMNSNNYPAFVAFYANGNVAIEQYYKINDLHSWNTAADKRYDELGTLINESFYVYGGPIDPMAWAKESYKIGFIPKSQYFEMVLKYS